MSNEEKNVTILAKEKEIPDFTIKKVGTPTILSLLLDLKDFDLKDSIYVDDQKNRVIFNSIINIRYLCSLITS